MNITMIVAAAENNEIGKHNQMLWKMPNDFRYFKNKTWGLPVLMGRRTYQALGNEALAGRLNIILTRNKKFEAKDATIVHKIDDALFFAKEHDYKELMVIGGAEIYNIMLPKAHNILLTCIAATFEDADAFFPELNAKEWNMVSEEPFQQDEKNPYNYNFQVWERRR